MSASQPQVAPQASGAPTEPSNAQAAASQTPAMPSESSSGPTATNANADRSVNPTPNQDATIAAGTPTPGQNTTPAPATQATTPTDEPLSYNDKLNANDRYWKFKFGFYAVLIITGLVGIGCFAWLMSTRGALYEGYGMDSFIGLWPALITWSFSIVWCICCVVIFLTRKRAVHPGTRVAVELLLWLAFLVTSLFALFALQSLMDYGLYGGPDGWTYNYSNNGGDYVLASNNTWVWETDNSYISSPRDCTGSHAPFYNMDFKDCAEQDAFVNRAWAEKPHRTSVNLTGVVCQFFGLAIHFALFVWACVDTNRYNRSKISNDAEKLAAGIVEKMIQNGAIVPPPGQAHLQPGMGQRVYYQVPPQGYSMQPVYMQQGPGQPQQFMHPQQMGQQQYMMPMQYPMAQQGPNGPAVGTAGPSNEKAARYA
ncbi:hypothetical protein yc1106_05338 [Curvularia clavata]|uniref:Uncharacterized protein n=1 Tax=Curvularia clavata TaxID=95742 RepID=A0A9Q8ZAU6_CURCL|nr:hypothetical protein yc1106_05338 [Curvularia clavata]